MAADKNGSISENGVQGNFFRAHVVEEQSGRKRVKINRDFHSRKRGKRRIVITLSCRAKPSWYLFLYSDGSWTHCDGDSSFRSHPTSLARIYVSLGNADTGELLSTMVKNLCTNSEQKWTELDLKTWNRLRDRRAARRSYQPLEVEDAVRCMREKLQNPNS